MPVSAAEHTLHRRHMIAKIRQLSRRFSRELGAAPVSERVLDVMAELPRHRFVPPNAARIAYADEPLAIGHGQTISQPFMVALMTSLARIEPGHRVLEVGTGSGYQTAVLAKLASDVFSIEVVPDLARAAIETLAGLGIGNVAVRVGDGNLGLPSEAPFNAILVTAAPEQVPQALVAQLKPLGRLIIPVGNSEQVLQVVEKAGDGSTSLTDIVAVRFVPLVRP